MFRCVCVCALDLQTMFTQDSVWTDARDVGLDCVEGRELGGRRGVRKENVPSLYVPCACG